MYLFFYLFSFAGTIHIYTICRHLMMRGQSAKVWQSKKKKHLKNLQKTGKCACILRSTVLWDINFIVIANSSTLSHGNKTSIFLSPRAFMALLLPRLWNRAQHDVLLVFEMGYVRLFQRALGAFFFRELLANPKNGSFVS